MFYACLAFVHVLSARSMITRKEASWYTCDDTLHGSDICSSRGLAAYVSYGNSPPEPSVLYAVSSSQLTFAKSLVTNTLRVTEDNQSLVSGKFTGFFTPNYSGRYVFQLISSHTVYSKKCYFPTTTSPSLIELDLTYGGGTEYELSCKMDNNSGECNDPLSSSNVSCTREYDLVAGVKYPFFAGLSSTWGVDYTSNLFLSLTYTDPDGNTNYITDSDSIVRYAEDDESSVASSTSESVSEAEKSDSAVIAGACAGVIIFFIFLGIIIYIMLKRRTMTFRVKMWGRRSASERGSGVGVIPRRMSESAVTQRKSGFASRRRTDLGVRTRSGLGSRARSGFGSRNRSGFASRKRSGLGIRRKSGAASRKRSGLGIRRKSGAASRRRSGLGIRRKSGAASRRRSAAGSRRRSGVGSRRRSGAGSRKRSGAGSRRRSGVGSRRRSGAGSRKRSGAGSRRRSGAGSRRRSGAGSRRRSGAGSRKRSGAGNRRRW